MAWLGCGNGDPTVCGGGGGECPNGGDLSAQGTQEEVTKSFAGLALCLSKATATQPRSLANGCALPATVKSLINTTAVMAATTQQPRPVELPTGYGFKETRTCLGLCLFLVRLIGFLSQTLWVLVLGGRRLP